MTRKIMVLCEDSYGVDFFKDLIERLKKENVISKGLHIDTERFYGPCNTKLTSQMKVMVLLRDYNFFVIIADADGNPIDDVKSQIECHVPRDLRNITRFVILQYEIEEWICKSLNIKINDKPSKILKHKFGYEKYKLRDYVPKLNFKRLKNCESFSNFMNFISLKGT